MPIALDIGEIICVGYPKYGKTRYEFIWITEIIDALLYSFSLELPRFSYYCILNKKKHVLSYMRKIFILT
jgi:hypothetical protein